MQKNSFENSIPFPRNRKNRKCLTQWRQRPCLFQIKIDQTSYLVKRLG